jgi:hypothetical protein
MPEFDPKSRERCERVDDQSTAVTGDVIALVGIRFRLNRAVHTDRMGDPFVLSSGDPIVPKADMTYTVTAVVQRVTDRNGDPHSLPRSLN